MLLISQEMLLLVVPFLFLFFCLYYLPQRLGSHYLYFCNSYYNERGQHLHLQPHPLPLHTSHKHPLCTIPTVNPLVTDIGYGPYMTFGPCYDSSLVR